MKKILSILSVIAILFSLTACAEEVPEKTAADFEIMLSSNQEVVVYGAVHKAYIGKVTVKISGSNEIDVEIDDYFLPHYFLETSLYEGFEGEVLTIGEGEDAVDYVKFIMIGSNVYEVTEMGGHPYLKSGRSDYETMILTQPHMAKAYVEAAEAGMIKVLNNAEDTTGIAATSAYGALAKDGSTYWPEGYFGTQGWQANIDAIEMYFEENGFGFELGDATQLEKDDNDKAFWSVNDVVTGATNSDFVDYAYLVQVAADKLEVEIVAKPTMEEEK
jgi:hypothetical protein